MKVSLFVTCLTDQFYPRVGQAVVGVLEHLGCDVDFPTEQTCCGQPMFNTGCHDDAADLARRMIDVFEESHYVVTPSGSCCAMIRDYYFELLEHDKAYVSKARKMVAKTYEFTEFLMQVLKVDLKELGCAWPGGGERKKVTYHYSCHLRGLGMTNEAVQLLKQIEGVDYQELEKTEQCCGFGGTFAVKYPQISGAMVQDKTDCIRGTEAEILICNDGGCALNIMGALNRQGSDMRTKHLAEVVAEGLGLMDVEADSAHATGGGR